MDGGGYLKWEYVVLTISRKIAQITITATTAYTNCNLFYLFLVTHQQSTGMAGAKTKNA